MKIQTIRALYILVGGLGCSGDVVINVKCVYHIQYNFRTLMDADIAGAVCVHQRNSIRRRVLHISN